MTSVPGFLFAILAAAATRDTETYLTEFRSVPEGWLALGALIAAGAGLWFVVWMYRREGRVGSSLAARMFLAVVRCVVLALVMLILLEPVRVKILRRWVDAYALVLVDDSGSMDLADRYRDEGTAARVRGLMDAGVAKAAPRREIVERLLSREDRKFLRDLSRGNRVKLYTFGDDAHPVATLRAQREPDASLKEEGSRLSDVAEAPLSFPAAGPTTNLDRALRRAVESLGSAPLAGVVVFSDGGFNAGAPVEQIARYARERRLALHVVGVGDPSPPRNVRVAEVQGPDNAFQRDPFAISGTLSAEGLDGETVRVQLRERLADDAGEGQIVEARDVRVGMGGRVDAVVFERRQERVGRYVYTIEAEPVEEESVVEDNTRRTTVNVIDTRTRVLLVSGGPSWDYRFVTTLLQRDETIDVSCWLQSADLNAVRDGDVVIDHLPSQPDELFAYDVVILMDPDKSEFDESWCRLADTFVSQHGGGLLVAAARAHTPSFLRERAFKPLLDLLPVTLDPEADLVLNQIGHYQLAGSPLEIPAAAFGHPVLRHGEDPGATKLAWRGLGDVYWHYPVLREKPVATVLMRHGDPRMRNAFGGHVLAAVQFVGAGRAGFLGFDSAWRWRRFGEDVYDRFWVQFVRYLSEGKLLGGNRRATLLVENERPSLGEAVNVSVRLLNARYEPWTGDQVVAQVRVMDERSEVTLAARKDRPGWFEGRFVPDRVGEYRIRVAVPDTAGEPIVAEQEMVVNRPNLEILRPQMDRAALVKLAEESAGGRYWELDELGEMARVIPDLHEEVPVRSRPTVLWDRGWMLGTLIGLLSLEWAVRKWKRLL